MKAQFVSSEHGFHRLEIMPDDHNFNGMDGRISVEYAEPGLLAENIPNPRVEVNCQLKRLTPADAQEWSDILAAAARIAMPEYSPLPWWNESICQAYREYYLATYPAPTDGEPQTLDNARAILASSDFERMKVFLSTWYGESVAHHPPENLAPYMSTAVRTLEQEASGEIEKV